MKRFSDFAEEAKPLDGEKVKIKDILDKEIAIIGYRVATSKFRGSNSSQCLTLPFELEWERRVLFTGSGVLIEQIEKYGDQIPFLATIRKIDKYYTLT